MRDIKGVIKWRRRRVVPRTVVPIMKVTMLNSADAVLRYNRALSSLCLSSADSCSILSFFTFPSFSHLAILVLFPTHFPLLFHSSFRFFVSSFSLAIDTSWKPHGFYNKTYPIPCVPSGTCTCIWFRDWSYPAICLIRDLCALASSFRLPTFLFLAWSDRISFERANEKERMQIATQLRGVKLGADRGSQYSRHSGAL